MLIQCYDDSLLVHLSAVLQQAVQQLLLQVVGPLGERDDQVVGEDLVHPQTHLLQRNAGGQKASPPGEHNVDLTTSPVNKAEDGSVCLWLGL